MKSGFFELQRQCEPFLKYVLEQLLRVESCGKISSQNFLDPGAFPHPFLRLAVHNLNKAHRMMRDGRHEAGRFMRDLKECLISWVGAPPPGSPGAILVSEAPPRWETRRIA